MSETHPARQATNIHKILYNVISKMQPYLLTKIWYNATSDGHWFTSLQKSRYPSTFYSHLCCICFFNKPVLFNMRICNIYSLIYIQPKLMSCLRYMYVSTNVITLNMWPFSGLYYVSFPMICATWRFLRWLELEWAYIKCGG